MKIQDLAHQIVMRTMEMLEHEQHYKIPEDTRKKIARDIRAELNDIIRKAG
jgi:hypothetical protein